MNFKYDFQTFENALNPAGKDNLPDGAKIIGYGEISSVFSIQNKEGQEIAVKRLPVFSSENEINDYKKVFFEYNEKLRSIGLNIPDFDVISVKRKTQGYAAYVLQEKLKAENIANTVLSVASKDYADKIFSAVIGEIEKVWRYNAAHPDDILGLDGQISNWALADSKEKGVITLQYIDTSTPFIRKNKQELFDAEILLQSAPALMRPILKSLFLQEILDRYYSLQDVFTDMAANFFKEDLTHLLPDLIFMVNKKINSNLSNLNLKEMSLVDIEDYYKRDKFIWQLFLAMRRADRWIHKNVIHRQYEFILPVIKKR